MRSLCATVTLLTAASAFSQTQLTSSNPLSQIIQQRSVQVSPISAVNTATGVVSTNITLLKLDSPGNLSFDLTLTHTGTKKGSAGWSPLASGWTCGYDGYERADSQSVVTLVEGGQKIMRSTFGSMNTASDVAQYWNPTSQYLEVWDYKARTSRVYGSGIQVPGDTGYYSAGLKEVYDIDHSTNRIAVTWKTQFTNPKVDSVEDLTTHRKLVFTDRSDGTTQYIRYIQGSTLIRSFELFIDPATKNLTEVRELIGDPLVPSSLVTVVRSLKFSYLNNKIAAYTDERNNVWTYNYETQAGTNEGKLTSCVSPVSSAMTVPQVSTTSLGYGNTGSTTTTNVNGVLTKHNYTTLSGWSNQSGWWDSAWVLGSVENPDGGSGSKIEYFLYSIGTGTFGKLTGVEERNVSGITLRSRSVGIEPQVGRVISKTDALGRTVYQGYEFSPTDVNNRNDPTLAYTFEKRNVGPSQTPTWVITRYIRNASKDLLYTIQDPIRGSDTKITEAVNSINSIDGSVTLASYDAAAHANLISEVNSYYANGELQSVTKRGATTYFTDRFANGISSSKTVTSPFGATVTTSYDALDRATSVTKSPMPDGTTGTTTTVYDDLNSPKSVATTAPDQTTTVEYYDAAGNNIESIDQSNSMTLRYFDAIGRVYQKRVFGTKPGETEWVWSTKYNVRGQIESQTDPGGKVTSFLYDNLGRMIQSTLPGGQIDKFSYDFLGRKSGQTVGFGTPESRTTFFTYDLEDRILRNGDAPGFGTSNGYVYNTDGSLKILQKDSSNYTTYVYDGLGRKTSVTQVVQGKALQYGCKYDSEGRIYQESNLGRLLTYKYITGDTLSSIVWGGSNILARYTYNMDGSLKTSEIGPMFYQPTYDQLGRVKKMTYDGVASYERTFTPDGQMLSAAKYEYSESGLSGASPNALYWMYEHDSLGQLTNETTWGEGTRGGATSHLINSFTYDKSGNRTVAGRWNTVSNTGSTGIYSYSANNRMTNAEGTTISYDGTGTPYQMLTPSGVTRNFNYDVNRRLSSIADSAGSSQANLYDGDGQRVIRTDSTGTTRFMYDGGLKAEIDATGVVTVHVLDNVLYRFQNTNVALNPTPLLLPTTPPVGGGGAGAGALVANRGTGSVGKNPRALTASSGSFGQTGTEETLDTADAGASLPGDWFDIVDASLSDEFSGSGPAAGTTITPTVTDGLVYLFQNFQGSTFRTVRSTPSGYVVDREAEYTAYGETLFENVLGASYSITQKYKGKPGYQSDEATGYDLLGERFYSPRWGRFLSEDPIGEQAGLNFYAYCGNSPLLRSDPNGTEWSWSMYGKDVLGVFKGYGSAIWGTIKSPYTLAQGLGDWAGHDWNFGYGKDMVVSGALNFWAGLKGERGAEGFGDSFGQVLIAAATSGAGLAEGSGVAIGRFQGKYFTMKGEAFGVSLESRQLPSGGFNILSLEKGKSSWRLDYHELHPGQGARGVPEELIGTRQFHKHVSDGSKRPGTSSATQRPVFRKEWRVPKKYRKPGSN